MNDFFLGSFDSPQSSGDWSMLLQVSVVPALLLLGNILLYGYTIVYAVTC